MGRRAMSIALGCVLTTCTFGQQITHKLTNEDVIAMVTLGLSDAIVVDKIQTSDGTDFDTSVRGLANLKAAHVSDAIIQVMIKPHRLYIQRSVSVSNGSPDDNLPSEIGVYVFNKGRVVDVEPEIVGWQTGGLLKRGVTLGLDKGHINGTVVRTTSPMQLASPVEIVIRAPEGTSATEYQLLHLYRKGNRREFRAVTGGVFHASGGAKRNAVQFDPVKIGPYTWRFKVSLRKGEYGLLPPGISAASIASSGKIYSFAIIEEGEEFSVSGVDPSNADKKEHSVTQAQADQQRIEQVWASQARTTTAADSKEPSQQALRTTHGHDAWLGASSADSPKIRHNGVSLSGVEPDSPAYRAGLQVGDVILTIDGKYIYTVEELSSEIQKRTAGSTMRIGFMRGTATYETAVVLGNLGKF